MTSLPPMSRKDKKVSQNRLLRMCLSLPGAHDVRMPIKVLCDTAASQSFVLEGVLPFNDKSYSGENVLVQGFEMGFVNVPLHFRFPRF